MTSLPLHRKLVAVGALVLAACCTSLAQLPNLGMGGLGGKNDGMSTDFLALARLFGSNTTFTAKLDMRVYKDQKESASIPMNFAKLDDKIRLDLDATQIKNEAMPAGSGEIMKQAGLDRIIVTIRPDLNMRFVSFPGIQSCLQNPLSKEEAATLIEKQKLDCTVLGKETIDGHPCVKNKVVAASDKGKQTEYTVWNATDLKNFPVQILTKEKTDTIILRYKDVRFVKPDAKQFDLPTGFAAYTDPNDLMKALVMKMASEAGGTPAGGTSSEEK
jgi:hypothetical protein